MNSIWDNLHDIKQPKKQRVILENSAKKKAEYNARYNRENTVTVLIRLNKNTDADLIKFLNGIKADGESKSGFFKTLAKDYISQIKSKNNH